MTPAQFIVTLLIGWIIGMLTSAILGAIFDD